MDFLQQFGISEKIIELSAQAERDVMEVFDRIDKTAQANTAKVMASFVKHRVSAPMFSATTGYGYDDIGRDTLDLIYADIFGAEAALVRSGFVNGTHAITAALFSGVRPGDTLLAATGLPYDTLQSAIGITGDYPGTLRYYGINYAQVELLPDGTPDINGIRRASADPKVREVTVQRSSGYSARPALSVKQIGDICSAVHEVNPHAAVIVDNCYGEFTEFLEPTQAGADLIAGSLIKNPGGGLAPTGGYVSGRKDLVEAAAMRLTSPGIGGECGCTVGGSRMFFQGLFMAPHTVAQALKTAVFCSRLMELLGYKTRPASCAERSDIIQSIDFGSGPLLERFCRGIQSGSPVDSYVTPEAWDMPGYEDKVIMAAGTFVQGASIELSCDGPMREPYTAYLQGGLTYESGKLGIMIAADRLNREK
ncbi:MAG: aminotransferase class I/II-fold pyridoxal phosphate-dependent enzyme [Oscillospiraceae bacterium]